VDSCNCNRTDYIGQIRASDDDSRGSYVYEWHTFFRMTIGLFDEDVICYCNDLSCGAYCQQRIVYNTPFCKRVQNIADSEEATL